MADADVRWLQRLENYERALATLERAFTLAASRPLSELEQQGLIQAFEFTHELSWLLLRIFWSIKASVASVAQEMQCEKPW